jgi:hypothetical protein
MSSRSESSMAHDGHRNLAFSAGILCLLLGVMGCTSKQITPVREDQLPNDVPSSQAALSVSPASATRTPRATSTPEPTFISGAVADCRYPSGDLVGIPNARIQLGANSVSTDDNGTFQLEVASGAKDPLLQISADGFETYTERPSRMVNGAFYLIPEPTYKDLYSAVWERQVYNRQNWMRRWTRQPAIVIAREQGTAQQVLTVTSALRADDVFNKMTGGRYHPDNITVLDKLPSSLLVPANRDGKIIIYFAEQMMDGFAVDMGGSAYAADHSDGDISYAEIVWPPSANVDKYTVLHELTHAIGPGGHINYRASIVSETFGSTPGGEPNQADYEFLNCIYNSPLRRSPPQP